MENTKQILSFLKKNPGSTKKAIGEATSLKGIILFNTLRSLKTEGRIVEVFEGDETTYSLVATNTQDSPSQELPVENENTPVSTGRDSSKYKFNGEEYGKGPLVRAVVAQYVADNPSTTYKKLKEVFPDDLLKRFGIFQDVDTAAQIATKGNRYFTKEEHIIKLKDRKIVVCNQFTLANIQPFLKVAKTLGYKIK